MANGIIPDPYYGTNEDSVQWVGDSVWIYQTTIPKMQLPEGNTIWLVFEGLAGQAIILVNHELFEVADNMFCQYEFPITRSLMDMNDSVLSIIIEFWPVTPYKYSQMDEEACEVLPSDSAKESEYGIPLPDRRAFTRIAPYQQGWDWGPKLPTCGIWKPVYITNKKPKSPKKVNRELDYRDNLAKVYLADRLDSIGKAFAFRNGVNGSKDFDEVVFMKGANWIPAHSFPVMTPKLAARYRYLLCSAKEANFNMIRVWGGGIYEHDYFFDLCDSLGLMVWMDFNFSTMLYPDNPEMLESIREEAIQNVARIMKHPCVVMWCGNNEVKNGWEDWGWQDVYHWTPEQRARLEHSIDTIFDDIYTDRGPGILAQAVRDYDWQGRRYISTSPLFGWGHPECTTYGDSHYWGVWWGEEPFEMYKEKTGRFMSEYGFQSYPLLSSIIQFTPAEQLNIDSPTLRSHQKHPRGREIIDKAMRQYYGFDSKCLNLKDYAYISQLLQAWGTGYGILCHLSDPRCAGTLYWQLNDCWPVASWSSIDYYGNWKALHYRAQALFADTVDLAKWQRYYSVYPKDRTYNRSSKADYQYNTQIKNGKLTVNFKALIDLYDVYLDTEPHINGHFTKNFVDLKKNGQLHTTFIPADPKADISNVKIRVKTLNEIYRPNGK
jgi:beta-mannosidase